MRSFIRRLGTAIGVAGAVLLTALVVDTPMVNGVVALEVSGVGLVAVGAVVLIRWRRREQGA